ncbi:MAG: hypothetical protein A3C07_04745 [Candidatus Sungbacteria bacterium RIFCSPHIGHO2_02_FULL_47_11]|uniref:Uncharacterized protein n=1 Tax=Candidatus Sungbacteria bacterium RIFCSPHIGHO2_02_FULL_47_11 TaxID=1802270 RepID=A0A1G2KHW8_9BACT|nr:MAG: hypothetical protein A3C07_04745 [Candidatus Sungbacteria bacterium RIFCSPHIGHO2_02_FULL_47_11]
MTAQAVRKDEPKIELSCREAQLLLRTISLDVAMGDVEKVSDEQRAAMVHASECNDCVKKGFLEILGGPPLDCKHALEIWAGMNLYRGSIGTTPFGYAHTLREKLALEHIFGRQLKTDAGAFQGLGLQWWDHNRFGKCDLVPCKKTNLFVLGCDSTRSCGAVYENYHQFLLELFFRKGWGIETVLDKQVAFLEEELKRSHAHEEVKSSARRVLGIAQIVVLWLSQDRDVLSDHFPHRKFLVTLIRESFGDDPSGLVFRAVCGNDCSRLGRDCGVNCFAAFHSASGLFDFIDQKLVLSGTSRRLSRFDFVFKPEANSSVV